jgi:hypothetical protein
VIFVSLCLIPHDFTILVAVAPQKDFARGCFGCGSAALGASCLTAFNMTSVAAFARKNCRSEYYEVWHGAMAFSILVTVVAFEFVVCCIAFEVMNICKATLWL